MKALLIDHDDSFTYNLQHWLTPHFAEVQVLSHRELSRFQLADLIVLSPGPKHPQDYPHVTELISRLSQRTPVLGVCLGMQIMVQACGGKVQSYSPPLHGKSTALHVLTPTIEALNGSLVARYHSLQCAEVPAEFELLAENKTDRIPMWIRHRQKKWTGLQFHPESFLTEKPDIHLRLLIDWLHS